MAAGLRGRSGGGCRTGGGGAARRGGGGRLGRVGGGGKQRERLGRAGLRGRGGCWAVARRRGRRRPRGSGGGRWWRGRAGLMRSVGERNRLRKKTTREEDESRPRGTLHPFVVIRWVPLGIVCGEGLALRLNREPSRASNLLANNGVGGLCEQQSHNWWSPVHGKGSTWSTFGGRSEMTKNGLVLNNMENNLQVLCSHVMDLCLIMMCMP
jgi:hypothetical protein